MRGGCPRRVLVCISCLVSICSAWDPFGIGGSIADKIRDAGDHLIGVAKEAFEEAIRDVVNQDIKPLVDKVNAMILEDAEAIKKDVEEVVHNATEEITGLIDHCAEVAQKFMDHEIDEIKNKIIDEAANKAMEVEDHFFQGVSNVLQQLYKIVQNVNCMVQGDIDKVYEDIYKLISTGCMVPDACCRKQGLYLKTLKNLGDSQLYNLEVCRRADGVSEKTTIADLQNAYMDMQVTAKKFYCIDFGTGSARDHFTREYNKWGVEYNAWAHPPAALSSCRDDSTPPECYQQAFSQLVEARKTIPDQAGRQEVRQQISTAMPSGTILAWSGSADAIPAQWQLSDGTNGSPDLRAKFIRACQNLNDCTAQTAGGSTNTSSISSAHGHTGNTGSHALTTSEMPPHRHTSGSQSEFVSFGGVGPKAGWRHTSKYDKYLNPYTSSTGGGKAHLHTISDDGVHSHKVNIIPSFYNLAFIVFKGLDQVRSSWPGKGMPTQTSEGSSCTSGKDCYAEALQLTNQTFSDIAGKVSSDDVRVDMMSALPSGSIGMWSGSPDHIPAKWHLCDGQASTPNLSGKFIRSCERTINSTCNVGTTGGSSNTTTSASGSHSHGSSTGEHTLTLDELPAHNHVSGEQGEFVSFGGVPHTPGWRHNSAQGTYKNPYTTQTGGGKEHAHPIAADGGHSHTVDVTPPFHSLGMIMFQGLPNLQAAAHLYQWAGSAIQDCGEVVVCYRLAIEKISNAIEAIEGLTDITDVKKQISAYVPSGLIALQSVVNGSWAACDGKGDTPDLQGRYIRGCERTAQTTCDIGEHGGAVEHTTSAAGVHTHTGASGAHVVTVDEMPPHNHIDGAQSEFVSFGGVSHAGWRQESQNDKYTNPYTQNTGGGKGHTHSVASDGSHTHSVGSIPPFHSVSLAMFKGLLAEEEKMVRNAQIWI